MVEQLVPISGVTLKVRTQTGGHSESVRLQTRRREVKIYIYSAYVLYGWPHKRAR